MIEAWLSSSRDHGVLIREERLEQAAVRVEARGEEDRVVGSEERGEPVLELPVELLGAADESHGGHPVAPAIERIACGIDHPLVVRKPEVVVRAEVQHLPAPFDLDMRALRGRDHELGLVGAGLA